MKSTQGRIFFLFNILYFLSMQFVFPQMQAAHWVFGKGVHIEFPFGDFPINTKFDKSNVNDNIPQTQPIEGTASISDVNGNLLLYTNGENVYNANREKLNTTKLKGIFTSTQSSLFIPYPGKYNKFILFTIFNSNFTAPKEDVSNFGFGLYYYIIDLNKNNGKGELIIPNNNRLMNRVSEKITGVFHSNKKDIWLLTHFEDKFYAYLINENGVNQPVITKTSYFADPKGYSANAKGYLKISPNGKKVAIAHQQDVDLATVELKDLNSPKDFMGNGGDFYVETSESPEYRGHLELFDFDKTTGKLSKEQRFAYDLIFYGVEFSPSSEFLYFHYYNDGETNILLQAEVENLKNFKLIFDYIEGNKSPIFNRGALQLGVNGKIYHVNTTKELSTINYPNNTINNIDFKLKNQTLNTDSQSGIGLPNFITDYLKEELKVLNSIDGTNACLGTPLKFWVNNNQSITTIHWDFGDGNFSNEVIPTHIYNSIGTYIVKAIVNGQEYSKTIIIHEPINLPIYEMKECDADGDGITGFDLQNFIDFIGNKAIYITFHNSENDAMLNLNKIQDDNYKFEDDGTKAPIWARILGAGGCISITKITFAIDITSIIPQTNNVCKSYFEGNYYVNIQSLKDIISDDILIFNSAKDADLLKNQITNDILVNENQKDLKLYIRKRNFSDCDDIIELNLNLLNPYIVNLENQYLCPFDGNVFYEIKPDADIYKIEWKDDSNKIISTEYSISISKEGKYSVTITNNNGCQYTHSFEVNRSNAIQIKYIIDKNRNLIIDYGSLDPTKYIFSLDNGITWNSGNTFPNLPIGTFDLWIKEIVGNACLVYQSKINNNLLTNFFSPNNDGINDKWSISGFEKYEWIQVEIYDRFGKPIVNKKINNTNEIWDGKVNSFIQPSGSYWYSLKTSTNETYEGYVILKSK